MKITVAIVCSNDHLLRLCLDSIPNGVPIIVVLNFPDKYIEDLVMADDRITVVRYDERNLGLLRQIAADACETPGILYLDSDSALCDGGITIVEDELEHYQVLSLPIRYKYSDFFSKVVSACRLFTTPDEMLFMPFAFRLSVQNSIGCLFNKNLSWGEDSDQRDRLEKAGICFAISKSRVFHKELSIIEDARSAMRLGVGAYIKERNGLSFPRKFMRDLSLVHEIRLFSKCVRRVGLAAGLYHLLVWRPAYKIGYWLTRKKVRKWTLQ